MKKSEELVSLRKNIVETMKSMSEKWVTSDDVKSRMVYKNLESETISLERIGNNLRVLKDEGIVADTRMNGKKCWSLTGNEFSGKPVVKMVIAFPKEVHEGLSKKSFAVGLSKTGFIIQLVRDSLSK